MFLGLTAETWSIVGSVATAIGTFVAALAVIAAFWSIRQNTHAMQLQVLESIFKDIRELDRQYIASFHSMPRDEQTAWSASFFNTVEYLCFVAKAGIIRDKRLKTFFFQEALPAWKMKFDEHVSQKVLGNKPTSFSEFKAACKSIPSEPESNC